MLKLTNENIMYGGALQDVENYVVDYANQITIEHGVRFNYNKLNVLKIETINVYNNTKINVSDIVATNATKAAAKAFLESIISTGAIYEYLNLAKIAGEYAARVYIETERVAKIEKLEKESITKSDNIIKSHEQSIMIIPEKIEKSEEQLYNILKDKEKVDIEPLKKIIDNIEKVQIENLKIAEELYKKFKIGTQELNKLII